MNNTPAQNSALAPVYRATRTVSKQRIMPLCYPRFLLGGRKLSEAGFIRKINDRLGPEIGPIPLGRARSGFYLLAKLAVKGARRQVLMSPFTLPDLVTMVQLAGGEPVFYDFEKDSTAASLENLFARIGDQTACVFVTHYHVNEPHLPEIAALCRAQGAYLFDDCALAFGGTIDGHPIGTLTDASVFSFSAFKLLNYFWGGLITTRDGDLSARAKGIVGNWPRLPSKGYLAALKACLRYDVASRPLAYGLAVFPTLRMKLKRSSSAKGLEHIRVETDTLDPSLTSRPSLAALSEWDAKIGEIDGWLAKRREVAAIYRRRLGRYMVSADTSDRAFSEACFVNFPIIVPGGRCDEVVRRMILDGYDVGRSLYPNSQRHPKFCTVPGETANVDKLVANTLYLPTHFGVTTNYAEEIADHLLALLHLN
jgi:perosamine synthetase